MTPRGEQLPSSTHKYVGPRAGALASHSQLSKMENHIPLLHYTPSQQPCRPLGCYCGVRAVGLGHCWANLHLLWARAVLETGREEGVQVRATDSLQVVVTQPFQVLTTSILNYQSLV